MDFTLTDEQEMLRDTARTLLGKECPPSLVLAHRDDPTAADDLWRRHLSSWTVLGDGDLVDLCLFCEQLGQVLAPGPFLFSAGFALPLLRAADHEAAEQVAAGEARATVAMAGRDGHWVLNDDDIRTFVPEAEQVDLIAFVLPGPQLLVVEPSTLAIRPVATLDTTRLVAEVELPADRSAASDLPAADLVDALERVTVALAAELVGVARHVVDASVAYAKDRVQFGVPIGSFQGLQWKLVDMALDLERATAAVYYAAMAVDADDPDRHRAVHVAKGAAGTAARHAVTDGIQTHGGIGYTWEHELHLYLRRAYASDYLLGDATWHHDRLADLLFS